MTQPIGSRLHGALDYLTGAGLLGVSQLPVLRGRFAGRLLAAAGASHIAYSLVTDYELGAVRTVPYPLHLAVDAAAAFGILALGATRTQAIDRWVPMGVGLFELTTVALSDPSGRGA
jgi:hypothetical protein